MTAAAARVLDSDVDADPELITLLEDGMSADDDEGIRRELAISRDLYGGDIEAELRAWADRSHPLHPNRRG